MKVLGVLLLATSIAEADLVVSVPVFALSSRAVAAEAELPVARHVSFAVAAGVRDPAGGDFGGYALAVGPALRAWRRADQRGVHAVLRMEASLVQLRRADMDLGTAFVLDPSLGVGYRFVLRDRLTITPDVGFGGEIDFGHRSIPTHRRWTFGYGVSVGGRW